MAKRISSGVSRTVLGRPGHEVAPAHLGLVLVLGRVGRTDGDLDLFGRALADGDAVLAAHVVLDRGVDVERADPHRLERDDPAEADDRRLARATADVDDHVADRLVDRQVGADRSRHRLLDEVGVGGAGAAGGVGDGATLDLGDRRRHADHDLRAGEPADADSLQQQPDHPLGDLEVRDRPAPQRPHGHDVTGRPADHLPRLAPRGQHLAGLAVEGDDRRLVEHDAAALHVDERVGRPEVDGKVTSHASDPSSRHEPCG